MTSAERARLASMDDLADPIRQGPWHRWGPYLSERAWGTVREDYSANGDAWSSITHDQARSRAYRWNEDGMAGVSDRRQRLCLALSLWNGVDPILKERMFGLTGPEGNHGEDVKEYWWYTDALPSHAWLRWRYHYPQAAFPYGDLVRENARRGRLDPEYELIDTGVFADDRFWIVEVDHAKAAPDDLRTRIRITNAGPDEATLHVLPTAWFRNTWSWGLDDTRPELRTTDDPGRLEMQHATLGHLSMTVAPGPDGRLPTWLVCDNETDAVGLWGARDDGAIHPKNAINDHVVTGGGRLAADGVGTKASAWYRLTAQPGETLEIRLRLAEDTASPTDPSEPRVGTDDPLGAGFDLVMAMREREADEFFAELTPEGTTEAEANTLRQAVAGMIWGKQYYAYDVGRWLAGDPASPAPPADRLDGRNGTWRQVQAADVISMPDPWEYPWFAAWDLAFHAVVFAHIDPAFAKDQLILMCREWYMHPNGQLPAYEWSFGDVNPPVHAWAALRVYEIDGRRDSAFLERIFQKLLLNFTWWVNRKDEAGNNLFQGGFLGLDNIGPFDRSNMPFGGRLEQADGTGWMAAYSLWMLDIALELTSHDEVYEDVATKFFEHFSYIATALNGLGLWDEEQGFFFDRLVGADGTTREIKVRSIAGLVPLVASASVDQRQLEAATAFARRARWFLAHRPEHADWFGMIARTGDRTDLVMGVVGIDRMLAVLRRVFDEGGFLSPHGIRSLSRRHLAEPFAFELDGVDFTVGYEPAESQTGLFGGNSNWRGPVWFPLNVLVIGALLRYADVLGDGFQVEYPTGSGRRRPLVDALEDLATRLISVFTPDAMGNRPADGARPGPWTEPAWRDQITFYEYFDGDTGAGLGASHQTGWTGLVAHLILERATYRRMRADATARGEATVTSLR
ncbi:MAG TPA: hypothetical protein VD763_03615 [Candidatus Saccharimonadales bacterium]|nr:hypothetical protein [Candidatus Saccharimonadales bacterium]